MPTERPRITITMTEEQFKQVQDFQYGNKMKNQTQAILHLIDMGFKELDRSDETKKETLAPAETNARVNELSTEEKLRVMLRQLGLIDQAHDLDDSDLAFLEHIFLAVQAYFKKQ